MERPGLLKSVSAVVVFAAAFLAVSNYLGGGTGGIAAAGLLAVGAAIVYFIFYGWIVKETRSAPRTRPRPRLEPVRSDPTAILTLGVRYVCDPGPYDVESSRPTKIPLEVERGFTLVGTIEEEDGDDFEFMIIDEDNWVSYQQGRTYDVEDEGDGESIYKIEWKVPADGPWFLILDAYGKQLVREVKVNLRTANEPDGAP